MTSHEPSMSSYSRPGVVIPAKPNRHAVACVGELADGQLSGCSRTPQRFLVALAPTRFGMEQATDSDAPAIKVCGVCSRHVESLRSALVLACPIDADVMEFTISELLEVWDDFFVDLHETLGGAWDVTETRGR